MSLRLATGDRYSASPGPGSGAMAAVTVAFWVRYVAGDDPGAEAIALVGRLQSKGPILNVVGGGGGSQARVSIGWEGLGTFLKDLNAGQPYFVRITYDQAAGGGVYIDEQKVKDFPAGSSALNDAAQPWTVGPALSIGGGTPTTAVEFEVEGFGFWTAALDATQGKALRDRTAGVGDVEAASLVAGYTWEGTDGADALTTDAGWAELGTGSTTWTRSGDPDWAASAMTYTPPVEVASAVVAESGRGVIVRFRVVAGGAAATPTGTAILPTIAIAGIDHTPLRGNILKGTDPNILGTKDYIYFPFPAGVSASVGQSVTITAPHDWVTTASGACIGPAGLAVANDGIAGGAGVSTLPDLPTTATMRIGANLASLTHYSSCPFQSNLINYRGGSTIIQSIATASETPGSTPIPSGTAMLLWDSASGTAAPTCWNGGDATSRVVSNGAVVPVSGTTYRRPVEIGDGAGLDQPLRTNVLLQEHGDATAYRFYDPSVDWTDPPKFHPARIGRLQAVGATCLRNIEFSVPNDSNCRTFADMDATGRTFSVDGSLGPFRTVAITGVAEYTNPTNYFDPNGHLLVEWTCPGHGLVDGSFVDIEGVAELDYDQGGVPKSTLVNTPFNDSRWQFLSVKVVDADTFATAILVGGPDPCTLTGTSITSLDVSENMQPGGRPADFAEACVACDADCWWCMPSLMPEAEARLVVVSILSALPPGKKLYLEWSNEVWNNTPAFHSSWQAAYTAREQGTSIPRAHVRLARPIVEACRAEAVALGRGADFVGVYGSQWGSIGGARTAEMVDELIDLGHDFATLPTAFAIAPYFGCVPQDGATFDDGAYYAGLDLDQLWDVMDLSYDHFVEQCALHAAVLPAGCPLVCYEGGYQALVEYPHGSGEPLRPLNRAGPFWPRSYRWGRAVFAGVEAAGCTLFVYFNDAQVPNNPGDAGDPEGAWYEWGLMPSWGDVDSGAGIVPGYGDGRPGSRDNAALMAGGALPYDGLDAPLARAIADHNALAAGEPAVVMKKLMANRVA